MWPWAAAHPWQAWRQRYLSRREEYFDPRIKKLLKEKGKQASNSIPLPTPVGTPPQGSQRVSFTPEDDNHLVEYIATECPQVENRKGNALYKGLVNNVRLFPALVQRGPSLYESLGQRQVALVKETFLAILARKVHEEIPRFRCADSNVSAREGHQPR